MKKILLGLFISVSLYADACHYSLVNFNVALENYAESMSSYLYALKAKKNTDLEVQNMNYFKIKAQDAYYIGMYHCRSNAEASKTLNGARERIGLK